ncbi:FG-GAP-like repeat-containing protein [Spongiimicrobium salis]|uniref:FG-GAP-like repeat-containing protein n=1 Tax=Spongiimicrobium salis TaxID=1667022 RepID=UPI00374D95FD
MKNSSPIPFMVAFASLFFFFSCADDSGATQGNTLFKSVSKEQSGIDFANTLTENDSLNYFTYGYIYMGGGVSAGDINNDGLVDLFFTGNMVPNKLYLNKGNLKFEDISVAAGVQGDDRWYTGVTMADVNNDGFLDIYCAVGGKFGPKENQLFINNGDSTFTENAKAYGLADSGNSVQSTFFDYDQDGDLDLYVANYPPSPFNAPNQYYRIKKTFPKLEESDRLYRNDGNSFTDVTEAAGLLNFGLSLSATVGDVNQDGWPDLYVSNDFSSPDLFYINNGDGTFSENLKEATKNTSFYGMGVDIADFNNDQLLDIFQVDMTAQDNRRSKANMASMNPDLFWSTVNSGFHYQYMQNSLQMNNGTVNDGLPDFSNVSRLAGISSTDWSWGPLVADLDNDGWKDVFISNGTRREINNKDYFEKLKKVNDIQENSLAYSMGMPSEKVDNFVYRNKGDLSFEQMNTTWGLSYKGFSNGSIYVDLDNDGDLEIINNNIDDYATIFENSSALKNNHITLKFKGNAKNPFGIGVKAYVTAGESKQFQEMTLTRGFQSSVAPQLHFGLGKANTIDSLRVQWPDGKWTILTDIKANQFLDISHGDAVDRPVASTTLSSEKIFSTKADTTFLVQHRHIENFYDDFDKEVLLPHQTSMFGPGIDVGDLNGDGLEDFVVGGASYDATAVYYQTKEGFVKQPMDVLLEDKLHEDIDVHIFDAEMDGDNDLYVVSGGNEFEPNSPMLQDRLYINDGQGNFSRSATALPEMITSGSRVHPYDFDEDGDLDLFVGGRLIPGNYPQPANSYILENVSTKGRAQFKNVTATIAPDLNKLGMVTDARWTDYDKDGQIDLVIVGEWMPITVLKNTNGRFENKTTELGLSESNGWWFSIEEGDFDQDGDMDFIVGNLGLNFKYKANAEETFDIYSSDFDNNEHNDIVLSYYNGGEKYPVRGRECSSQQIPSIKKKFENYTSFSTATLEDVYSEDELNKSLHYQVKSFASIYLENKGTSFVSHTLPQLAQISNINRVLVEDFDGDEHLDVVIAGNLHNSEVETPRNDASNGLFLKGDGQGNFTPITAKSSGFFAKGDVKDMTKIRFKDHTYILVAKNSDYLQFIQVNTPSIKKDEIALSQ